MFQSIQNLIFAIPVMLWIFFILFFFAGFHYLSTKNIKKTQKDSIFFFCVLLALYLFFQWNAYLSNHFVAEFNESGIPIGYTRSGWLLLIDAYLLWLPPTILSMLALYMGLSFLPKKESTKKIQVSYPPSPQKPSINQEKVADQLIIEDLKHKLNLAQKKIHSLSHDGEDKEKRNIHKNQEEIRQYRIEATQLKQENAQLNEKMKIKTKELERANTLIDKFLKEKFEKALR